MSIRCTWFRTHLTFNVFILVFSLNYLFIVESGILKSSPSIALLSISPFNSFSICLIYFVAAMLGAYMFTVVLSPSKMTHLSLYNSLLAFL